MRLAHRIVVAGAIALPLVSLLGGGGFAFTMYASSVSFRLDIVGHTEDGRTRAIAPTTLASRVGPSVVPFVAGADHFRRTYDLTALRNHLRDLGRVACTTDERAVSVDVTLFERPGGGGDERSRTENVACVR